MEQDAVIYDVIGIGFGPSNLALAIAAAEGHGASALTMCFLEQKPDFAWHPDMLLPDAEMQISFLKDLVTLRNPGSPYSFLHYLQQHGRLAAFANLRHFYPSRCEFNDYLRWVAAQFKECVEYGQSVCEITVEGRAPHQILAIHSRNQAGHVQIRRCRNIVLAPGGQPHIPFPVSAPQEQVWHSAHYLRQVTALQARNPAPHHLVVIGRGQSAAEITRDLHQRFPAARVSCLHRGFGMKPADDSEFVNQVFDPEFVDFMYHAKPQLRANVLQAHQDTNYAVVDADLIRQLYHISYQEKVSGAKRLQFYNFLDVKEIRSAQQQVRLQCETLHDGQSLELLADAVVLATGYRYPNPPTLLAPLQNYLQSDSQGRLCVSRSYRVACDDRLQAGVYLQGCNEHTHGLSDTLLSVLALRSQEIVQDLLQQRRFAPELAVA